MESSDLSARPYLVGDETESFGESALPPGFDEAAYRRAFPDVAHAIESGERRSGLEHYLECGQQEGRLSDLRYLNATSGGMVEIYGRHEAAESWIFAGWVARSWPTSESVTLNAVFERGAVTGAARVAQYLRDDLPDEAAGFLAVVPTAQGRLGPLRRLELHVRDSVARVTPNRDLREAQGKSLSETAMGLLVACPASDNLAAISDVVRRRFVGESYVDSYGIR